MKKSLCCIFILVLALPLVFAGGRRDRGSRNKIVIYTSMYEDVYTAISNELKRQFPRYNIEFVYGGTGTLQARVAAEQASGRLGCDILMVAGPAYSMELKEKGMLHSYQSRAVSSLAFDYDSEGYWYPVRVSNMVLAYNPERNARNTIPNSFHDFANDASLRGTISMSNPLISGTTMAAITALKEKYGFSYFEALGRQGVMINSGPVALEKLESGEVKAAMILEELILKQREEKKSRLEIIYPNDGTIMIPSSIMIVNEQWSANRNTSIAEEISDWFLSPEGQNAIVAGWMHSVRINFPILPSGSISSDQIRTNSMPINWENYFRQGEEILSGFEESVTHNR